MAQHNNFHVQDKDAILIPARTAKVFYIKKISRSQNGINPTLVP